MSTAVENYTMTSGEALPMQFNFTGQLPTGESIDPTGITVIEEPLTGITTSPPSVTGKVVQVTVSAATPTEIYLVRVQAKTLNNFVFELAGRIFVRDPTT